MIAEYPSPFIMILTIYGIAYVLRYTYLEEQMRIGRIYGGRFYIGFVRFAEVDYNTYTDRLEERGIVRYL